MCISTQFSEQNLLLNLVKSAVSGLKGTCISICYAVMINLFQYLLQKLRHFFAKNAIFMAVILETTLLPMEANPLNDSRI